MKLKSSPMPLRTLLGADIAMVMLWVLASMHTSAGIDSGEELSVDSSEHSQHRSFELDRTRRRA
jgi:hypothetical protein